MRFLISRLSSLGDVVCSLPAASALKSAFPDCHITWMVSKKFAGIVEVCRAVDEVITVRPGFLPKQWPRPEGEFEAALDLQGLTKSGVCIAFVRAKRKLGYHWQREIASLFSQRVLPDPTSIHIVDQYVDVAREAGGIADRANFALTPKSEDIEEMERRLEYEEIRRPFVLINAGAGWASKRWPVEHNARLADILGEKGYGVIFIGGKIDADWKIGEEIMKKATKGAVSWIGQTSLSQLVALTSLAKSHVGGDTGSTHIAAALDIPAIGLYSITRPARSCPYGQIENCIYDPDSLSNITPEAVMAKLESVS